MSEMIKEKETEMSKSKKKDGKGKKIAVGIAIGIGVGIFTMMAAFFVIIVLFFFGGPTQKTTGADKYEATMNKYTKEVTEKVHTGFYSFPEKIPTSAFADGKEPTFYFSYKDTWDDPTCEVYLECEYSKEDYEAELERLRGKMPSYADQPDLDRYLKYEDSERFINPVYIAIERNNHSYEYAMDLGNNKIAYIYTAFLNQKYKLKVIPHEYLPSDYDESLLNVGFNDGFNVYITITNEEMGYVGLDYDR